MRIDQRRKIGFELVSAQTVRAAVEKVGYSAHRAGIGIDRLGREALQFEFGEMLLLEFIEACLFFAVHGCNLFSVAVIDTAT
jgi:hypothetical protein